MQASAENAGSAEQAKKSEEVAEVLVVLKWYSTLQHRRRLLVRAVVRAVVCAVVHTPRLLVDALYTVCSCDPMGNSVGKQWYDCPLLLPSRGGTLTDLGEAQAGSLGQLFRATMYPGQSLGLLRLHSTFRHDMKIYASDEGLCSGLLLV